MNIDREARRLDPDHFSELYDALSVQRATLPLPSSLPDTQTINYDRTIYWLLKEAKEKGEDAVLSGRNVTETLLELVQLRKAKMDLEARLKVAEARIEELGGKGQVVAPGTSKRVVTKKAEEAQRKKEEAQRKKNKAAIVIGLVITIPTVVDRVVSLP